jgi:hypothetical protein
MSTNFDKVRTIRNSRFASQPDPITSPSIQYSSEKREGDLPIANIIITLVTSVAS